MHTDAVSQHALHPRSLRTEQAVMLGAGFLLITSGVLHGFVWLIDGGPLTGPVSLRKPILFGLSAGVTLISLGWLDGLLKRRWGDPVLLSAFGLAMLIEVGLITLQHWRGVPSHFNYSTPFDHAVLLGIEGLIIFVTLVIAFLTLRTCHVLPTRADMTLAIRGGMILLLLSCLIGFVLVIHGNQQTAIGRSPEVFGKAGVMKFPHGAPMHAIQVLPFLVWLMERGKVAFGRRLRAVAFVLASISIFSVFSMLQTFTGRDRFDVWWLSSLALLASIVPVAIAVVDVARPAASHDVVSDDDAAS